MPKVLDTRSFGFRDSSADRLIVTSGSPLYDTVNLPGDSASETSMGGGTLAFRAPWYDDANSTVFTPSTDVVWFLGRYYTATNNTGNDAFFMGLGHGGAEYVTVSAEDSTNKITIRVAGVLRATATVAAFSLSTWARIHLEVQGDQSGDKVNVYTAGDLSAPVLSYTLSGTDQTNLASVGAPNEFIASTKPGASTDRFDDFLALDPLDADFEGIDYYAPWDVAEQMVTGDGVEDDFAGSFEDINERPPSASDKITATTVGAISTFTKDPIGEDNVFFAKVTYGVERSGTAAGTKLDLVAVNGADETAVQTAAPGSGYVSAPYQKAPDGTAWSPSSYDDTEFGARTVT